MLTDTIPRTAFPTMTAATRKMVLDTAPTAMAHFDIDTPRRVASFIGQCAHESAVFKTRVENLNYSSKRLMEVWPKHFPSRGVADRYAGNARATASRAYANRMGNGDEASGDGAKFLGRAWIMITGRNNYTAIGKTLGKTIDQTVAYLDTPQGAFMASAWFWQSHRLNDLADGWQITASTKVINGGTHGLDDRKANCNAVLKALEAAA